ncbi:MAG: hypothetical protein HY209_05805 [Candidatus Omnitrophica bacterium]|nr:hypothetical protein [Candidatus Omnitrophota bacterium]
MTLIFCLFFLSGLSFGFAQQKPQPIPIQEGLTQRIALDLRDMDIIDALKFLAMKAGINIIAAKDVSGRVSLFLKGVTTQDALTIILQANSLAYEIRRDVLYVMTEKEYKAIHGSNFSDTRKVKILNLKYAKPEAVFKAVDTLKSDIGKVMVDEESGAVILMDTPERISEMEKAVADLDQVTLTKTFILQYAKAKDLEPILAKRLDAKKTGTVAVDERSDQLIVTAFPDRMQEIEDLIRSMDKKTKQVLIEARILKVILNDNFSMGVDWNRVWTEAKLKGLNFTGVFPLAPAPTNFLRIGAGNDAATGFNYSAVVQILKEFGETHNLSSPSIAVINGQEAKMLVGTTQPYVTTTVAAGTVTATTAAQVSFVDVGVQLTLTPFINNDGYVTIKIKPEISTVDQPFTYSLAPGVNNTVPIVSKTTAETTVMIKDGRTVIIGGLRKDDKVKTVNKVPVLGDIPFLGVAFRNTVNTMEKTEVVVFITPHIISGGDDSGATVDASQLKPRGMRSYE